MTSLKLREYQKEDVVRLLARPTMGCFNEQRTGKTPTAITVFKQRRLTKYVVVCPASAVYPWCKEIKRWGNLSAIPLVGTATKRKKLLEQWEDGVIVLSYGCLKQTKVGKGLVEEILSQNPQGIIADEAHRFKTPTSAAAKAMFKLTKIPYRLALTGTPAPNKPEEVFSILKWLYPSTFKSYWHFVDEFFQTYTQQTNSGHSYIEIGNFLPGQQIRLQKLLNSISIQRKRKSVMPWLPEKDRTDVMLPLTKPQTKYLTELEQYYETENIVTQGVLDRLIRYRQICLAPELLSLIGKSPKTEWLLEYFGDYPDTPTIVFSKFTSYLKLVQDTLIKNKKDFRVIVGETPLKARAKAVDDFQTGKTNILLVNLDAGKEALTLDRGECIIFTDQYPPAADIQQAEDRFVSTTEDKADKPHRIIRLMMEGSYDERMYELVEKRASTIDLINDYKKYIQGE